MVNFPLKRLSAFVIDYLFIILYAATLFGVVTIGQKTGMISIAEIHPFQGQLIGLLTLTIPVFLYFFLSERKDGTTIGKQKLGIRVQSPGKTNVFVRNLIKFLPWEIAHTGVHWLMFYNRQNREAPAWVMVLLLISQAIVIIYIITVFTSKGRRGLYDKIAGTQIVQSIREQ